MEFQRYLELMANQNVTFWGFSTGNEPLNGIIGWVFVHFMSLGWTTGTQVGTSIRLSIIFHIFVVLLQAKWVGDFMGPLLRNSSFKDVKLLGGDDQRYVMPFWFEEVQLFE